MLNARLEKSHYLVFGKWLMVVVSASLAFSIVTTAVSVKKNSWSHKMMRGNGYSGFVAVSKAGQSGSLNGERWEEAEISYLVFNKGLVVSLTEKKLENGRKKFVELEESRFAFWLVFGFLFSMMIFASFKVLAWMRLVILSN